MPNVNWIYVLHVVAFFLAASVCLLSITRARNVEHAGTRRGLSALLFTTGV